MGQLGKQYLADAIAAFWEHKRDFWKHLASYERATAAWEKAWHMDHLMACRRMMKNCISTAKELNRG